jgi:hypothetical protein
MAGMLLSAAIGNETSLNGRVELHATAGSCPFRPVSQILICDLDAPNRPLVTSTERYDAHDGGLGSSAFHSLSPGLEANMIGKLLLGQVSGKDISKD